MDIGDILQRKRGRGDALWGHQVGGGTTGTLSEMLSERGSRAIVTGRWLNGKEHALNVINVRGELRYLDGQKGRTLRWYERLAFTSQFVWVTHGRQPR